MAAAEEMQAPVLQRRRMLQQRRMVQLQLELALQEMNVLLDETHPPEVRIRRALGLRDQVLQMLHEQGHLMNHLRLVFQSTQGLRDDAVAEAAAALAVRNESESRRGSANSRELVDAEDADQPPGGTDEDWCRR